MTETSHSAGSQTTGTSRQPANIVWIASYPESGDTWMRVFLWNLLWPAGGMSETGGGFDFLRTFATADSSRVDLFERFLGKSVGEASFDEVSAVRPRVQAAIAAAADGVIALKSHSALGVANDAPTIDLALMIAAIYLVRNPLDVAVSLADHFGSSVDMAIDRMGLENCTVSSDGVAAPEFWGSWSQNVGSWTGAPNPQIMPVRYEDMLSAPQLVFPAVAKFLGIRTSDGEMAAAMQASSFRRLQETEERSGFSEARRNGHRFFREDRAGGWREKLNEDQIRRLVAAHHVQMTRVGYLEPGLMQYLPESAR